MLLALNAVSERSERGAREVCHQVAQAPPPCGVRGCEFVPLLRYPRSGLLRALASGA